jgi:hypothetical protein
MTSNFTFNSNLGQTGTWRAMASNGARATDKSGTYGVGANIWVRVS